MGSVPDSPTPSLVRRPAVPPPDPTAAQRAAAEPCPGVKVVRGGPGTGKTEALMLAALRRLEAGGSLQAMAVVVSSRSEAQRIRREIMRRIGGAQVLSRITTLHGLALGWLRELGESGRDWRLLRAPEQELRIRELIEALGPDFWPPRFREAAATRAFARQLREVIARARQHSLDPADVARFAAAAGDDLFPAVAAFFEQYLTVSDFDDAIDYAELIYRTRLLLADDSAAAALAAHTEAVLVDDVQGLDTAQVALLTDLAGRGIPVHAFGDPLARIHSFRGADAEAASVLAAVPGAVDVTLATGFRSRAAVASAVERVRSRLDQRMAPPVPSAAPGDRGRVSCTILDDAAAGAAQLAGALYASVQVDGLHWSDLAVMVRAGGADLTALARDLTRRGIPVDVVGDDVVPSGQPAVETLLLALEVAAAGASPDDRQAGRLLASPLGGLDGIGRRRLSRLLAAGAESPAGCLARPTSLDGLDAVEAARARALAALLHDAADLLVGGGSVAEALWRLWSGTEWPTRLRQAALQGDGPAGTDLDAVVELFELANRRPDLVGAAGARTFAREVAGQEIAADTGRELALPNAGVALLTAHRAVGGEWRRVWLMGVQEGVWPNLRRRGVLLDPDRLGPDRLEAPTEESLLGAERRLFAHACSRAREELHVLAYDSVAGEEGRPSRFLADLGVVPERISGRPRGRLAAEALIGELRRVAADQGASDQLRRAAAARLARLGEARGRGGRVLFPTARTRGWWGLLDDSSGPPPASEVIRISASDLEAILECPRRWFLSRRAAATAGQEPGTTLGTLLHSLAQRAVTESLDAAALLAELDLAWEGLMFPAPWVAAAERAAAEAALERFARWDASTRSETVGVELPFSVTLAVQGREVELVGCIDRLHVCDGALRIYDLKTGRREVGEREVLGHAQLGLYQLAARHGAFDGCAPGIRTLAAPGLVLLRHGSAMPRIVEQPSLDERPTLEGEDLTTGPTWVHDRLARAVAVLVDGSFPATPGAACRHCPFVADCPAHHGPDEAAQA